ncbi:hypothetical protein DRE_03533 [Drechslerella stenobrocha 248]|uniref:Thiamine phosphate synthase/TenI domain-containing protein n=1 Tax=Drechslerella stenobrocha 248 TaxID=1043628 RepID=W7HUJ2_9PEZI|nr:hypothetical protein DRE_03533 [Drechslerella stenobrocha 248]
MESEPVSPISEPDMATSIAMAMAPSSVPSTPPPQPHRQPPSSPPLPTPTILNSPPIDLSLYLVTSSSLLPPGRTLEATVEAAIKGGVTVVQLREKALDTRPFIDLARRIHAITKSYDVPLLINDRVDVALAVGCEGVHIGWDDMDYETARRLLGPTAIIGLSVSSLEQASLAAATTCDYIGVGPVLPTPTKPDASSPLFPSGVRDILASISNTRPLPAVAIGGISATNVQSIVYKSRPHAATPISGIAVVSAIIASDDPESASSDLLTRSRNPPPWAHPPPSQTRIFTDFYLPLILSHAVTTIRTIKEHKPLVHHITNAVVKPISANVTLAVGGSPIMSDVIDEVASLANISPYSGCLINMGTSTPADKALYAAAISENNQAGKPVVFDPVGAGATGMRRDIVTWMLREAGYVDVIKGNEGEIRTVAGQGVQMKGVDSTEAGNLEEMVAVVQEVANRERNIVILTGPVDILSDGTRTVLVRNGHPLQGLITGAGCALGSVLCAALAVSREDKLSSCLAGILAYNIAAERAVAGSRSTITGDVKGTRRPGSFAAAFLDELYEVTEMCLRGEETWTGAVNLEFR